MKSFNALLLNTILFFFSTAVIAQNGNIRGTITDASTGEPIMFANLLILETSEGNSTDLDGVYDLIVPGGTYSLQVSYIGYANLTISDIVVKEGEVTLLDLQLEEDSEVLQEVVVTAAQVRNTESAVLTIQRKAPGLLDGISKQSIRKSGDGDVGAAIKRVTGVSVESGKHVIVRGLSDRYSKTTLNNMDVPGLDPDRNSVQLDIFPTNLIDNLVVYKSFTPDLTGEFSGGLVNILTKQFPEEKSLSVSMGLGFNPSMNLNNNFISYEGTAGDYLASGANARALPLDPNTPIPSVSLADPSLSGITKSFNPTMNTQRIQSGLNSSMAISFGNQINKEKFDIGFTLSGNYKIDQEYLDDYKYNYVFKDASDPNEYKLIRDVSGEGEIGTTNVLWSLLAGTAIKTDKSKISLSLLRSQSGTQKAAFIQQERTEIAIASLEKHNLEYTQRSVTNLNLSGKHNIGTKDLELNWSLSPTLSKMDDPDIRLAAYEIVEGEYELNPSTGGGVSRTWRSMEEMNYAGRVDLQYGFDLKNGNKSKIKFGFSEVFKDRGFSILDYVFSVRSRGLIDFTGNPEELFSDEVLWSPESDKGLFATGNREPANSYSAQQNIFSGYVMNEFPITNNLKATYGVRIEKVDNWYTGRKQVVNNPDTDYFFNTKVIDELDILPSLNLVYKVFENRELGKTFNIRGSVSQTVARPTFKEKSIAQIVDRITGRTFIGNIDVVQTQILNTDLRLEYYLPKAQIFAVSAFYKKMQNPIEITAFDDTSPNSFTPRNVGEATILGLEFEMRKNLAFISQSLENISLGINTTLVDSKVEMTEEEYNGRIKGLRTGEVLDRNRDMVGQSPYVINASIAYLIPNADFEFNMNYNVQGRRLAIAGVGFIPDVYEEAFNSLNLGISKKLGKQNQWTLRLAANNLLNDQRSQVYSAFNTDDRVFESFSPGRSFSLSANYNIF